MVQTFRKIYTRSHEYDIVKSLTMGLMAQIIYAETKTISNILDIFLCLCFKINTIYVYSTLGVGTNETLYILFNLAEYA